MKRNNVFLFIIFTFFVFSFACSGGGGGGGGNSIVVIDDPLAVHKITVYHNDTTKLNIFDTLKIELNKRNKLSVKFFNKNNLDIDNKNIDFDKLEWIYQQNKIFSLSKKDNYMEFMGIVKGINKIRVTYDTIKVDINIVINNPLITKIIVNPSYAVIRNNTEKIFTSSAYAENTKISGEIFNWYIYDTFYARNIEVLEGTATAKFKGFIPSDKIDGEAYIRSSVETIYGKVYSSYSTLRIVNVENVVEKISVSNFIQGKMLVYKNSGLYKFKAEAYDKDVGGHLIENVIFNWQVSSKRAAIVTGLGDVQSINTSNTIHVRAYNTTSIINVSASLSNDILKKNISNYASFEIVDSSIIKNIKISNSINKIYSNEEFIFKAIVNDDDGTPILGVPLSWGCKDKGSDPNDNSNTTIATISDSGLFKAVTSGEVIVYAKSPNGVFSDIISVVIDLSEPKYHKVSRLSGVGDSTGMRAGYPIYARYKFPSAITYSSKDNSFYLADTLNNRIREINSQFYSFITDINSKDPKVIKNTLNRPQGLAINNNNNDIYISDTGNNCIRKIDANGIFDTTIIAGNFGIPSYKVGVNGNEALFGDITGMVVDSRGSQNYLYIADVTYNCIYRILLEPPYKVELYAGKGGLSTNGGFFNGNRLNEALFDRPNGLAIDSFGNIYVADTGNHCIRIIAGDKVTTFAGVGQDGGNQDGTPGRLKAPEGIVMDSNILYIADTGNNLIRRVKNGKLETIAGTFDSNKKYNYGDAETTGDKALFNSPTGITVDSNYVVVSDTNNHVIRRITK